MIRPLPISTLFPYTTLFRSIEFRILKAVPADHRFDFAGGIVDGEHGSLRSRLLFELHTNRRFAGSQDRKSTRLNSSHVRISYAVFCLKKKKKNTIIQTYQNT